MTLEDAKTHLLDGGWFGEVWNRVPEGERSELAAWYTASSAVPNLTARLRAPVPAAAPAPRPEATGDGCKRCGGLMVRTGTCLTCQACGDSSGGCG